MGNGWSKYYILLHKIQIKGCISADSKGNLIQLLADWTLTLNSLNKFFVISITKV